MMIESVEFKNFKALRDAKLPLSQFTLIVGPNGSGKSTAMQALQAVGNLESVDYSKIITAGINPTEQAVEVIINWGKSLGEAQTVATWFSHPFPSRNYPLRSEYRLKLDQILEAIRVYSFDAQAIATPTQLVPRMTLDSNGANLAGVLDRLRDNAPERFEALNEELGRWLPEYDRILFDTPQAGFRSIRLRKREGHHKIPASELSQGTLLALALLTLAYLPDPAPIICIEEPDRGIHPRLLRDVRDALYRLSYPADFGEKREPVQVIATTHSPYLLDLFKDHPEEIVIAQKIGQEARFERLSDQDNIDEILEGARLSDLWYSGILGGVPAQP
ncbi:MAG TPA: AAA family ATPase [Blastocatellia bacterium]|nr:AAA family ATPase [Blastocatellia bacterium]